MIVKTLQKKFFYNEYFVFDIDRRIAYLFDSLFKNAIILIMIALRYAIFKHEKKYFY